ncbi:hypothetical protein [Fructilactobacillus myrtifloralis]|nr:hypothetical protein [Fructilactobacillus myrtifloralis]
MSITAPALKTAFWLFRKLIAPGCVVIGADKWKFCPNVKVAFG